MRNIPLRLTKCADLEVCHAPTQPQMDPSVGSRGTTLANLLPGATFTLHRLADKLAVKVSRISMHLALLHRVLELDERVVLRVRQACAICASSSLEHVHLATRDMGEGSKAAAVDVAAVRARAPG